MTTQEKYVQRAEQRLTTVPFSVFAAQSYLEISTDADYQRDSDDPSPTVEHLIDVYLHEVKRVDPAVTRLVDPLDYYLYTAPPYHLFDPFDYNLYRTVHETEAQHCACGNPADAILAVPPTLCQECWEHGINP